MCLVCFSYLVSNFPQIFPPFSPSTLFLYISVEYRVQVIIELKPWNQRFPDFVSRITSTNSIRKLKTEFSVELFYWKISKSERNASVTYKWFELQSFSDHFCLSNIHQCDIFANWHKTFTHTLIHIHRDDILLNVFDKSLCEFSVVIGIGIRMLCSFYRFDFARVSFSLRCPFVSQFVCVSTFLTHSLLSCFRFYFHVDLTKSDSSDPEKYFITGILRSVNFLVSHHKCALAYTHKPNAENLYLYGLELRCMSKMSCQYLTM